MEVERVLFAVHHDFLVSLVRNRRDSRPNGLVSGNVAETAMSSETSWVKRPDRGISTYVPEEDYVLVPITV